MLLTSEVLLLVQPCKDPHRLHRNSKNIKILDGISPPHTAPPPLEWVGFPFFGYWRYYPHLPRDSVSTICRIFWLFGQWAEIVIDFGSSSAKNPKKMTPHGNRNYIAPKLGTKWNKLTYEINWAYMSFLEKDWFYTMFCLGTRGRGSLGSKHQFQWTAINFLVVQKAFFLT